MSKLRPPSAPPDRKRGRRAASPSWGARLAPAALAIALAPAGAHAQTVTLDRPTVPSTGIATEGGPAAMWVNPANLSFDKDPRYGALISHDVGQDPTSLALTGGLGGLGVGLHHVLQPDGGDWSIDYATSIALPKRFAVGVRFGWHLVSDGQNYVGYDLGGSWRPLPWLGASVVAQNVGSAGVTRAPARSGMGLALRPAGDLVVVGFDWTRRFASVDDAEQVLVGGEQLMRLSTRFRPTEGLFLRGHVDSVLADGSTDASIAAGVGIEMFFSGVGAGVYAGSSDMEALGDGLDGNTGGILFIGTDEPDESLARAARRVPVLNLTSAPTYEPTNGLFEEPVPSWLELLDLLERAESDPGVRGLVVRLGGAQASWAMTRELRDRLASLRASDKRVIAYLHASASTRDYYVASAANHIVLHPAQHVALTGISAELVHLRGALDLLGVVPEFAQQAAYKSAPEQLTRTAPTPYELEAENAVLDDLYGEVVQAVAEGRGVDREVVEAWIDAAPWAPGAAFRAQIVDAVLYPDELADLVDRLVPGDVVTYDLAQRDAAGHSAWEAPSQVAVVYVDGPITPGSSVAASPLSGASAGAETVLDQLKRAATDPQVRAIVVRVDSPGGSVFAADEIHRGMLLAAASGKPLVVSMGGAAASGGYYIALPAEAIWAEPNTLTGSIGVYSGKLAYSGALERIGVTTTTLTRGRVAAMDGTTPWDPVERERVERQVNDLYAEFKRKVAMGRQLDPAAVEDAAQGRVWTGARAKELGLIDELGGLKDAIEDARRRAGVPPQKEVQIVSYGPGDSLLEALVPRWARAAIALPHPAGTASSALAGIELPQALSTLLLYARLDDHVLMMDPTVMELAGP